MDSDNPSVVAIKYCTVPAQIPLQIYQCYNDEECCEFGCCTKTNLQFYQIWYFWFTIAFIFMAIIAICWACKHSKQQTRSTRHQQQQQEARPRRCVREFIMDAIREETDEPPSYTEAMAKIEAVATTPPPDYTTATAQP